MPRSPKYTKEDLINAALTITRESGFEAVAARTLAKKLDASPTSIFTHYSTVEEILQATIDAAHKIYEGFVEPQKESDIPFYTMTAAAVRFAKEEPNLFKLIFFSKRAKGSIATTIAGFDIYSPILGSLSERYGLSEKQSLWITRNLTVYIQGLLGMVVFGVAEFDEKEILSMLHDVLKKLIAGFKVAPEMECDFTLS